MSRRPRRYPQQENIPSQLPSQGTPYMPVNQADVSQFPPLQKSHQTGYGGPPPVYVVSTFDARPITAVDFQTQSGSDPRDTGFDGSMAGGGPFSTSSIFYTVQPGRVALIRDFHILVVPNQGETVAGEATPNPIFLANGASNFRISLGFLVNGNWQEGVANIVSWGLAFGDFIGECYVPANANDIVEMRITANAGGSNWNQALLSMHGNLLPNKGYQLDYEPGTDVTLPVHEQAVQPTIQPANTGGG